MRIRSSPPRSSTANSGDAAGTATMPRAGRSTGSNPCARKPPCSGRGKQVGQPAASRRRAGSRSSGCPRLESAPRESTRHRSARCGRPAAAARSSRRAWRASSLRGIFQCAARARGRNRTCGRSVSQFCCVSSRIDPGQMAWIVPASTKIMSPAATGTRSGSLPACPRGSLPRSASSVVPGFTPTATSAPGSAASAYQHSVLPRGSPYFCAISSSGCTCTLSFSRAKMVLISSGESGDGRTGAQQRCVLLAQKRGQLLAGVRPGGNQAIVARQPHLADGFALGHAIVPGTQIAEPPHPRRESGLHAKRRQFCHRITPSSSSSRSCHPQSSRPR